MGMQKIQAGGRSFNLILNVLIGIKRTLVDVDSIPGAILEEFAYSRRLMTENTWFSASAGTQKTTQQTFRFYDYAAVVF
jgi:hypothetical protein